MRRFLALLIFSLIGAISLGAFSMAFAQDLEPPIEQPTEEPPQEEFTLPELSGTLDQQIAQLSAIINEVDSKIGELVFSKEATERNRLKRQVRALKRHLQQLMIKQRINTRSQGQAGVENIRENFSRQITQIEAKKAAVRRKTIEEFENLLVQDADSPSRANLIFRLGLLYFEDDYYNYQRHQEVYLQQVTALVNRGGDTAVGQEPAPSYARAISRFEQVISEFPQFDRGDAARYLLAYCLTEQSDLEPAIRTYQDLLKRYPRSPFVPEAHIRMGELYFDENRMENAIAQYKEVLKHPNSKFYDKALFKLGWSYYRLTASDPNALTTAVNYFTQVLEYYTNRPQAGIRGGDDLRQESVDYIAISFTDMDERGYPSAVRFVEKHSSYKWNKDILTKMAEVYFERDRYDEAQKVIEDRVSRWPNDPDNPRIHLKVVDALVTLGRYNEAIQVGEAIAGKYGPDSTWAKANQGKTGVIKNADRQRSKLLFSSATFHHENAQKKKRDVGAAAARTQYEKAADSYEKYLTAFPDAKDSYEATFNLAECYFELQVYDRAADSYEKVIARKKDKELYSQAVKNTMYAREQQFLASPGWPVKPPDIIEVSESGTGDRVAIETVPLSPQADAWVSSMKLHINTLPEDEDNSRIQFKVGEVYYYHGQYDQAVATFRDQIARYPNSEAAQVSMNLVIQALDRQGRYEELQTVAADYRNRVRVQVIDKEKNITNVQVLDKIQVGAGAKIAEQKIKEGKLQEGINEYLVLANKNPKSDKAPIALHNAAATYIQMGKVYEANDLYIRIARDYPSFEHAKKNLFYAATEYEKLVDFDRAVATYMLFVTSYPDDALTRDAMYNAALLRENNKEYQAATAMYQRYLDQYSDSPDAVEIAYSMANIYKKIGDDAGAEQAFANFTKNYNDAVMLTQAYLEWGNLSKKRGDSGEASRHYMQVAAVYTQASAVDPKAGAAFAAEAKFYLADIEYQTYTGIRLELPEKMMERQLLAKAESYKKLNSMYKEIVQIGNFEWATAALYMIGKINKDFADALFSAPIPEELNAEQQDVYIVKLEEMGFPLKQKSIDAFETNISKGKEEKTRNKWIDLSYDELKSYKPEITEAKYELFTFAPAVSMPPPAFTIQAPSSGSTGTEVTP